MHAVLACCLIPLITACGGSGHGEMSRSSNISKSCWASASRPMMMVVCTLLLVGCSDGPTVPPDAVPVPFYVVEEATDQSSGIGEAAEFVLHDQASWEQFWEQFVGGRQPFLPMPAVDFVTYEIVAVALGRRTPDYTVVIDSVLQSGGRLYAVVNEIQTVSGGSLEEGELCVINDVWRAPVATVAVESRLVDVVFVKRKSTTPCF